MGRYECQWRTRRRGAGHRRRACDLKRHDGHRPNGDGDDDNRRQWFLPVQRPATGHVHNHFWYPNRRLCIDECGSGWRRYERLGCPTRHPNDGSRSVDLRRIEPDLRRRILPASNLGDYVWSDTDGDGVQDGGEPGIGGVTVTLNGTTGDGSPVNLTTSTDGTGFYEFTDLAPGTYTVTFTTPGGSTATTPNEGGDDTLDSDADPVTGAAPPVTLVSGENNPTIDAGFLQVAEIGNYVWEDTNANGVQDGGEPGIGGVPVTLNGTTGTGQTVTETTTTDGNGFYLFSGLQPGTYTITFGTPTGGYVLTSVDQGGDDTNDSDAQPGSQTTVAEVLTSGESNLTYDAGFYLPASLGDYVWSDTDGDGVQDGGEPGIGSVTVTLNGTTGDGSPVNLTTSTDGTGFYEFTDLAPGTYTVTFTTPGGSTATTRTRAAMIH
ncbi:MAG: carboxypeptidase regulatory-like domain-containing protein [Lewinellaceae bacterium]|nr:carboxypeptidase regulatory-like domain-containing protein [Lewinellaceae bacterium]